MARHKIYCSFCGKKQEEVVMLVAGGSGDVFICDECVVDAQRIIAARKRETRPTPLTLVESDQ